MNSPTKAKERLDAAPCSARFYAGDRVKHSSEYRNAPRILSARSARRNRRGKVIAVHQSGIVQVLWDGWKTREIYTANDLIKDLSQNETSPSTGATE